MSYVLQGVAVRGSSNLRFEETPSYLELSFVLHGGGPLNRNAYSPDQLLFSSNGDGSLFSDASDDLSPVFVGVQRNQTNVSTHKIQKIFGSLL